MDLELKVQIRENVGKNLESLRKQGIVPATVYGSGHKPVSVQVSYDELKRVFEKAGESTLIRLKVGEESKNVLIHDISKD
jgi:large subunit ribosomal protein L25